MNQFDHLDQLAGLGNWSDVHIKGLCYVHATMYICTATEIGTRNEWGINLFQKLHARHYLNLELIFSDLEILAQQFGLFYDLNNSGTM